MDSAAVRQVRSFNRIVAERLGALNDRFLRRRRPMGEARLLWEIGQDGVELRQLRERLTLDSGYLSRALHSLEGQGLVKVRATRHDRRVRRASLTKAGLEERAELDRLSNTLAVRILGSLSERQRLTLVAAMGEVERLLQASMVSFAIEDPAGVDAKWCFSQYFAELEARFETGFDPALSISADACELTSPAGILVLARLRGRPVGCGAIKFHGEGPAELKRMWIAPTVRGLGVGRRLLAELERQASKAGVNVVRLETNQALKEAIALYTRSGYVEVDAFSSEPYADHWFEKRLGSIRSIGQASSR
jgi:DNA-binding MarR family transcriptional regulator/GNAT superfamily N-acetyltransferase